MSPTWAMPMSTAEPMNPARPIMMRGHNATTGAVSSCAPFRSASAGEMSPWRPDWSRKSGMYALAPKYVAEAMPITTPMRTVWFSSQFGHHRPGTGGLACRDGAATEIATALTRTSTDHDASAQRQSPWASGSTPAGVVSAVGRVSPIRMPLL